jgi:hypothetical protein
MLNSPNVHDYRLNLPVVHPASYNPKLRSYTAICLKSHDKDLHAD